MLKGPSEAICHWAMLANATLPMMHPTVRVARESVSSSAAEPPSRVHFEIGTSFNADDRVFSHLTGAQTAIILLM